MIPDRPSRRLFIALFGVLGGLAANGCLHLQTADSGNGIMIPVENPRYQKRKPLTFASGYYEDNSSCLVCHADFEEEDLSSAHMDAGITCMACHGDSLTHSGDEFNITRPDVIWGRAEIGPFCSQCHARHDDPEKVEAFRAEWLAKRRKTGRQVLEDSTCTDCHGQHAIIVEEGDFK